MNLKKGDILYMTNFLIKGNSGIKSHMPRKQSIGDKYFILEIQKNPINYRSDRIKESVLLTRYNTNTIADRCRIEIEHIGLYFEDKNNRAKRIINEFESR